MSKLDIRDVTVLDARLAEHFDKATPAFAEAPRDPHRGATGQRREILERIRREQEAFALGGAAPDQRSPRS